MVLSKMNNHEHRTKQTYESYTFQALMSFWFRSINSSDANYPYEVLHIWAENNPVNQYNNIRLQEINKPLFYLRETDQYPANVSEQEI